MRTIALYGTLAALITAALVLFTTQGGPAFATHTYDRLKHPKPKPDRAGPSISHSQSHFSPAKQWEYSYKRDRRNYGLSEEQCSAAFPKLYKEVDRAVAYRKKGGNVTSEELDPSWRGDGIVRAMIHDNQLYIIDAHGIWDANHRPRSIATLHSLNRAVTATSEQLPDIEFAFTDHDSALRPDDSGRTTWGYSRLANQESVWLMPDFGGLRSYSELQSILEADEDDFLDKNPKLIWRGSLNVGSGHDAREGLIKNSLNQPWSDVQTLDWHNETDIHDKLLSMQEHCEYMFTAQTEGNTYSGRLKYLLNCHSVLLAHDMNFIEHFHHLLQASGPEQNYVKLKRDFSDLQRQMSKLGKPANMPATKSIADNALKTFRERYLTPAAEACYWRAIIRGWASVQGFEPQIWEDDGKALKDWRGEMKTKRKIRGVPFESYVIMEEVEWDIPNEAPDYSAVSYCWGTQLPTASLTVFPQVHEWYQIGITPSLNSILRRISEVCPARWLWVDALCINQANEEEKSHQVSLMKSIYERAGSVYVWLGGTDLEGMDLHERPSLCPQEASCEDSWGNNDIFIVPDSRHSVSSALHTPDVPGAEPFRLRGMTQTRWHTDHVASKRHANHLVGILQRVAADEDKWWDRLWVIQELAVAKACYVFLGSFIISWHAFVITLTTNWGTTKSAYRVPFPQSLPDLQTLRENVWRFHSCRLKEWGEDLQVILRKTEGQRYSDERDRIYAILGLSSQTVRNSIPVDYQTSLAEVFATAASHLMRTKGGMDVFFDWPRRIEAPRRSESQVLPSWVPDFRLPQWDGDQRGFYRMGRYYAGTHDRLSSQYQQRVYVKRRELQLPCCYLDTVDEVAYDIGALIREAEGRGTSDFEQVYRVVLPRLREVIIAGVERSPLPEDPVGDLDRTGFLKTLCFGHDDWNFLKQIDMEMFGQMIEAMFDAMDQDLDYRAAKESLGPELFSHAPPFQAMLEHFFGRTSQRSLFATRHGFVGSASNDILKDDIVVVPIKASTPVVLRRAMSLPIQTAINPAFTLVSDSYVHGVMEGELMDLANSGSVPVESVTLV
ncbi:hypothetical protein LTR97_000629 [Elasticomyces elasticus]|uniref:Glycosyl transferase CAP10 domain-containing protein n=1 Tax=Elasticomyces elasticus TaxID=574655 RepID=A0AAN8A5Y9_9PEZI|nr:hypothetical protein LTR97_000629 [Elasticomyces elasticus]